jgi:hypothetical protein
MATTELPPAAVWAEIDALNAEINRMELGEGDMRSMLYYLTGADPRAMRDAIRFIRDSRHRDTMNRAWRKCPAYDRWPTYVQHDRGCRACRKDDTVHELRGKTSDRIRSGEIAAGKIERPPETPSTEAVRDAEGHGLGKGATTRGGNAGAE